MCRSSLSHGSALALTVSKWNKELFVMSNPVVFFDVTAGGSPVGRIEMTVSAAMGLSMQKS